MSGGWRVVDGIVECSEDGAILELEPRHVEDGVVLRCWKCKTRIPLRANEVALLSGPLDTLIRLQP